MPATVITLGTPHSGSDLATTAAALTGTASGSSVAHMIGAADAVIDPEAPSVMQMAETSTFIRDLPRTGWPPGTRVLSIAARSDPVVPNMRSRLDPPATNVVVTAGGPVLVDHATLPGSPAARIEIARFLGGQGPTCRSFGDFILDAAEGRQAQINADTLGLGFVIGGVYLDNRARPIPSVLSGLTKQAERRLRPVQDGSGA